MATAEHDSESQGLGLSPDDLLDYFGVPGCPRVFVLGCLEPRVTIHDQQIRATNLIWALERTKTVRRGQRIGIVGAGFAGITAAAAAKKVGFVPVVYEKLSGICQLQSDSTRWVHPRIYDWPEVDLDAKHRLPFMHWKAGPVSEIVTEIRRQARDLGLVTHFDIDVDGLLQPTSPVEVSLSFKVDQEYVSVRPPEEFSAVILAIGFGIEERPGYWNEDNIEKRPSSKRHYVGGLGDGGLIDVARLRLRSDAGNFYQTVLHTVANKTPALAKRQLRQLDRHARNVFRANATTSLEDVKDYVAEVFDDGLRRIVANSKDELGPLNDEFTAARRPDTEVVIVGDRPAPYDLSSSLLNRWLIALLRAWDGNKTKFISGKIRGLCIETRLGDQHVADIAHGAVIVKRFGPDRYLPLIDNASPKLAANLSRKPPEWLCTIYDKLAQRPRSSLDGARKPQWPASFWDDRHVSCESELLYRCIFAIEKPNTADLLELQVRHFPNEGHSGLEVVVHGDDRYRWRDKPISLGEAHKDWSEQVLDPRRGDLDEARKDWSDQVREPELKFYEARLRVHEQISATGRHVVRDVEDLVEMREITG